MTNQKIAFIGGGSYNWAPKVTTDLFLSEALRGSRLVLVDTDAEALQIMLRYCRMLIDQIGCGWTVETGDLESALDGADGVCVSIATGGYEAMHHDVTIPEAFGVFHCVGDTVGPGGISRTLRNAPVFVDIARKMEKHCPDTWMVHVTNPLAQITRCVRRSSEIRSVGLCHNYMGTRAFLANFFECERPEVHGTSVGVNHFTWLKDLTCRGEDVSDRMTVENYLAYEAGKRKLPAPADTSDEAITETFGEDVRFPYLLNFELYERLGLFPVGAASHVAENFPHYLHDEQTIRRHRIRRKIVFPDRRDEKEQARRTIINRLEQREPLPEPEPSIDAVAPVMAGLCTGEPTRTVVNVPNEGQIPNLPRGAVVETWAMIGQDRIEPIYSGEVPHPVAGMVHQIVEEEELAVEAALTGDRDKVLQAMFISPLVADKDRVPALADALLQANAAWLPQFRRGGERPTPSASVAECTAR